MSSPKQLPALLHLFAGNEFASQSEHDEQVKFYLANFQSKFNLFLLHETRAKECWLYLPCTFGYLYLFPPSPLTNNTTNKLCTDLLHEQIQISCWQWIIIKDVE